MTVEPIVNRILILKMDRLCAASLRHAAASAFPAASVVVATSISEARRHLAEGKVDLLLTGTVVADGDLFDLLAGTDRMAGQAARVLIATENPGLGLIDRLRAFPISGIFDLAAEGDDALQQALIKVTAGQRYWSSSVADAERAGGELARCWSRVLTLTEQVVFVTIGDGSADGAAARMLGLSRCYVKKVRSTLYWKLGVQDERNFVQLAATFGVVRFTRSGAVRIGFGPLLAEYQQRRSRQ